MNEIGLADAIRHLRQELSLAKDRAADESLQFSLGPIELELEMELEASAGARAGLKWVVVSVGGEAKEQSRARHRIRLTLNPLAEGEVDVKVSKKSSEPL